jgi:hypothetical protein
VRPSGSLAELDALVVEEDGNTLLNGDCAVIGRLEEKARTRSKKFLETENEDEDMMFSSPKRHGRTQSLEVKFIVSKRAAAIWALGLDIKTGCKEELARHPRFGR